MSTVSTFAAAPSRLGWRATYLDTTRAGSASPRLTCAGRMLHTISRNGNNFLTDCDRGHRLSARVRKRHLGEAVELDSERACERNERGRKRPAVAVGGLQREAEPVRRDGAEEALRSALRDPAGESPHEIGVRSTVAADELGPGPHRRGEPVCSP